MTETMTSPTAAEFYAPLEEEAEDEMFLADPGGYISDMERSGKVSPEAARYLRWAAECNRHIPLLGDEPWPSALSAVESARRAEGMSPKCREEARLLAAAVVRAARKKSAQLAASGR